MHNMVLCEYLQELAERAQAIGLNIPQLASLRDNLAALHWAARARALLASTEPDPQPKAESAAVAAAGNAIQQPSVPAGSLPAADGSQPGSSAPVTEAATAAEASAPASLQLHLVSAVFCMQC